MMEDKMINRLKTSEFHFVINGSLKSKIENISKLLKLSLSKTIIYIIENISVLSGKIHLLNSDENNKVEKVDWNMHIHVYFSKDKKVLYNRLKSIHKDNNTYSIACKLRYLLKVFAKGVELYGFDKFLKVIQCADRRWKVRIRSKKIWKKKREVRQLSLIPLLNIQYDNKYTVILIKLLN
jgi:hypothetical protein